MMFPVLIGKTKILKHIHTFGGKGGWFDNIHQQVLVIGFIIQIFLVKSQVPKFI